MRCEQIQERLSEYIEGLLDHENHTAMQNHLAFCPRCQAEVQTLTRGIRAVADLPSIEPPPGFSQKVMARIRQEAEKPRLWQHLFLPIRVKIPIHAMALLLIAGLAVYLYQADRSSISKDQSFKTPGVPPMGFVGERTKEIDKLATTAPDSGKELKRDESVSDEPIAKRKLADEKSAKAAAPTARDTGSIQAARYELTLTPKEPLAGMNALTTKLEVLVKRAGGQYLQLERKDDGLKQNFRPDPQIVWLAIPEDRYGRFKTDLAALGKIESEIKAESAASEPRSSAETSAMLRIKLTVRSSVKP